MSIVLTARNINNQAKLRHKALLVEYNDVWIWNMNSKRSNERATRDGRNVIFTDDDEDLDKDGDE